MSKCKRKRRFERWKKERRKKWNEKEQGKEKVRKEKNMGSGKRWIKDKKKAGKRVKK